MKKTKKVKSKKTATKPKTLQSRPSPPQPKSKRVSSTSSPAQAVAPGRKAATVPAKVSAASRPARQQASAGSEKVERNKEATGNGKLSTPKTGKANIREAPQPPPEPPPPPVKTYLTNKELKEFKDLLLAKRAELAGDVERLTSEALKGKTGGLHDQSTMPIHMADLGTDTWEQDFTLGLIANEQALVREIDDALARIEDRTYGICIATDKPISKERLRAKPWAKYCIEYARLREEGRAP